MHVQSAYGMDFELLSVIHVFAITCEFVVDVSPPAVISHRSEFIKYVFVHMVH